MARPLRVGDVAPPFDAPVTGGGRVSSADLAGTVYVLYFYPRDETRGCIAQACAFRDVWAEFRALGVSVLGVSRDSVESHEAFAARGRFQFPLVADEDGAITRAYGAAHLGGLPRRISYLINAQGRVADVFESHLRPAEHAAHMLEAARALSS